MDTGVREGTLLQTRLSFKNSTPSRLSTQAAVLFALFGIGFAIAGPAVAILGSHLGMLGRLIYAVAGLSLGASLTGGRSPTPHMAVSSLTVDDLDTAANYFGERHLLMEVLSPDDASRLGATKERERTGRAVTWTFLAIMLILLILRIRLMYFTLVGSPLLSRYR
jgi:hypothetical protein